MTPGSMWITEGRVVVFRTAATGYRSKGPRVGIVLSESEDTITVRIACGARRYCPTPVEVPRELVARDASAREASLGYPVDPVPPRKEAD